MTFSTKSRSAARLSLFPGETISITATVRPRRCLTTMRFARVAYICFELRPTNRVLGGTSVATPPAVPNSERGLARLSMARTSDSLGPLRRSTKAERPLGRIPAFNANLI